MLLPICLSANLIAQAVSGLEISSERKKSQSNDHENPSPKSNLTASAQPKAPENNEFDKASSESGGISTWVFITIGVSVLVVAVMIFVAAMIYRRKKRGTRTGSSIASIQVPPNDATRNYCPRGEVELHELTELNRNRENSLSTEGVQTVSIPRVKMINVTNSSHAEGTPFLLRSCVSSCEDLEDYGGRKLTRSLFTQCGDNENKLRGGNGDFHRQYVDVKYMNNDLEHAQLDRAESSDYRRDSRRDGRNRNYESRSSDEFEPDRRERYYRSDERRGQRYSRQSDKSNLSGSSDSRTYSNQSSRSKSINSHHSARSYLRIPPTLPSNNYVEVGLDNMSVYSEPQIKMEWLTKKSDSSSKNDIESYQSSSGTQTDCGVTSASCLTVFGTPWQFGGTFTSKGGVMQAKDSDVSLHVVANAILKGDYVDIYGAVFTDTPEIRKKFQFPADESLISPVVEYHREPEGSFQRPLCIRLPHSLTEDFDVTLIKVYTFSTDDFGHAILNTLIRKDRVNEDRDGYWEKSRDGRTIDIHTLHFSGYFCTTCSNTSLPSVCSMVFGSHVQITPSRREVRVTLYLWDRRLTIKDYLERIRKQESDVDRQLLTDMQIPLMDDATSDSRLVMRMDVMGESLERSCWRHICRPDGLNPLFKPLQARRLYDVIHCCRQTDPIRVQWALENVPRQVPGSIFQCCIDIMHVPRDIRDYETAMREDTDDLMRTFYVRDLKVIPNPTQEAPDSKSVHATIKRTISETLDKTQTERMCREYGITQRDIGNFKTKYTSDGKLQNGLVEECMRRHGVDMFLKLLPDILQRLQLDHVLHELRDKKVFREDSDQELLPPNDQFSNHSHTDCKFQHDNSPPLHQPKQKVKKDNNENSVLQKQGSSDSNDTVFHDQNLNYKSLERKRRTGAPLAVSNRNEQYRQEHFAVVHNKDSSSGSDSVLRSGSILSSGSNNCFTLQSLNDFSIIPQVGTFNQEDEDDTKKKEMAVKSGSAYLDTDSRCSNSGPQAILHGRSTASLESMPDYSMPFHSKSAQNINQKSERSQDRDQTNKKELYNVHTVV
uniref:ZU5 domain-containing protein n=1 Tax=Biomphalaria glabrata TaxID=6526 RepID=A0A2C9KPV6_BIOGL